jgi:4-amino-4-deoxy-L-arabinose transferase-like glycosyltransferase
MVRSALESSAPNASRSFVAALLIIVAFCATVIPTLGWLEFSSSMENLNVATVLEMRRGEESFQARLLPTLEGEPRTAKPPLTAWVTSLFVPCSTLVRIDNPDAGTRAVAYERLALQVRLSAVAASALILFGTWLLARRLVPDDSDAAWIAVAVAASSLYLLRFGRYATTDVHLALWVTTANVCIASGLLRRVRWLNALGAGVALGLALMSKGPVSLVQTLLPAAAFLAWRRRGPGPGSVAKINVAIILMIAVGGAWYAIVLVRDPSVWSQWLRETTRVGATDNNSSNPLSYLSLFMYVMPWSIFFVIGVIDSILAARRRDREDAVLALFLVAVPVVVMSFFPDRKERYLLPLLAPAAILAAIGVRNVIRCGARWPWLIHGASLVAIAVGLPVAGRLWLTTIDGRPWYTGRFTAVAVAIGAIIVLSGFIWSARRGAAAIIITTLAIMLFAQAVFMRGYRGSNEGRSDMRPLAQIVRARYPAAEMYNWRRDGRRKRLSVDLSIYLNRPTIWTPDPATIPRSNRPQIIATNQNAGQPDPQPPPGWTLLGKVPRDKDWYWAFVREP